MKKKIFILTSLLILFFLSFILYFRVLVPNAGEANLLLKNKYKNLYVVLRFFQDFNKNVKRNLNDYNVKFLPQTEFLNLKFKKIKIKDLEKSKSGYLEDFLYKKFHFVRPHFRNLFLFRQGEDLRQMDTALLAPKNYNACHGYGGVGLDEY